MQFLKELLNSLYYGVYNNDFSMRLSEVLLNERYSQDFTRYE